MTINVLINPEIPAEDKDKVDAIFKSVEEHMGFVPDGLRLYGISPPLLESFVASVGYFMAHPILSQELLTMIRYLVSSDAGCSFCIDLNAARLINLGKTHDQLIAAKKNVEDAPLTDAEKILLKIALAAINNPEAVSRENLQKAQEQGYTDRNIFDAVAVATSNMAFTHMLKTFKVEHQGALA